MSGLVKSTILVTILNGIGLSLGFLSNLVIAQKFGAGYEMDVYLAATTLPLFFTAILSGSLSMTFIPVFAEYREKNNSETWRIVSSFINISVVATSILTFVGILFADPIMKLLAPGFTDEKITESANLLCWLMPTIIFTVINELMSSVYYSNNSFGVPLLNKIITPSITMLYVLAFSASLSTKSLVFASLTAMFIQTLLLAIGFVRNKKFSYSFILEYAHPAVLKIIKLIVPLIAGMIIYRAIPLFDRFIASSLPDGSISYLGYSSRIYLLLTGIITSGISLSLFPLMSKLAAEKNIASLKQNMSKGIRFLFFLSIPITLIIGIYSKEIVQLLFERGAFLNQDSISTSMALSIYLIALPVASIGTIIAQGYYVLQDTRTPAIIGVVEVLVYIGLSFLLLPKMGFLAIPVTYVIYFYISMINSLIVRKKLGGSGGRKILISFFKHTLIAIASVAIIFYPISVVDNLFVKNIFISTGFIWYLILSKLILKSEEAIVIWEKIFVNGFRKMITFNRN